MNIEKTVANILANTSDSNVLLTAEQMGIKSLVTVENKQLTLNLSVGFPAKLLQETLVPAITSALQ